MAVEDNLRKKWSCQAILNVVLTVALFSVAATLIFFYVSDVGMLTDTIRKLELENTELTMLLRNQREYNKLLRWQQWALRAKLQNMTDEIVLMNNNTRMLELRIEALFENRMLTTVLFKAEIEVIKKSCNYVQVNSSRYCPSGWTMHASRCFLLSEEQQEWAVARNKCRSLGADLAVVLHADDQALLTIMTLKLVHHNPEKYFHSAWIGLSDTGNEGTFFWVNGEKLNPNVSFWSPGNPNNFIPYWDKHDEGQNCVAIVLPRHIQRWLHSWDDITCRGERHYLCEVKAGQG